MSSLYDGTRESQYRERSNNKTMAGVSKTPLMARCLCCGKRRTVATGIYSKAGRFVCGMCHSPRAVA